ncbi:MAG TPA: TIGR00366 family protein [Candidatus Sulfotelmatobacter sp.]|nr:TIGR00366 family protein [Candidatus Sulfotelmatobacter sp.]
MLPETNHPSTSPTATTGKIPRLAIALAEWAERWFPDALVFAFVAIVIVFLAGLSNGETPWNLAKNFGDGFWELAPFTLQMAMIIIGGYVVASSPAVRGAIRWLARIPQTPRGAVAFVALISTTSSLLSWGFSLILGALLVREIAQNNRSVDYRAASAAAYLGVGTVWALGLSSSAALMMATPTSIPPAILKISGQIPLTHTIFTWQSLMTAVVLIAASVLVAYLSAPAAAEAKTVEMLGVKFEAEAPTADKAQTPGEWLEHNGILTVLICALGFSYLAKIFLARGVLAAFDLSTYNFMFIMLGLLLHWKPRSFARAVTASVPATAGVLIQFPFYAGIFGIITKSSISTRIAEFFVHISSHNSYPVVIAIYSATLGLFVPSGGSKWVIEAPYILAAANQLHVNLGWVVQIYNTAEALPNLINPFWMLPLIGLLRIRARDIVGYTALQLLVNIPLVLFLMWLFARTLPYVSPGTY